MSPLFTIFITGLILILAGLNISLTGKIQLLKYDMDLLWGAISDQQGEINNLMVRKVEE